MTDEKVTTKKERIGISLNVYPDFKGERASRDFGIGKTGYKFEGNFPIPTNDTEAKALYDTSIHDLIVAGVIQRTYDRDTNLGNMITEAVAKNIDFAKLTNVQPYTDTIENDMSTTPERKAGAKSEAKIIASKVKEAGMTAAMATDPIMVAAIKAAVAKIAAQKK